VVLSQQLTRVGELRRKKLLIRCLLAIAVALLLGAGAAAQPAAGAGCDRDCLIGIAEQQYLDALVAKDPKRLPLAVTVK
jgi:hypothetical protein